MDLLGGRTAAEGKQKIANNLVFNGPIRLEYVLSGVIHNLDEGDPEMVYFKRLR